MVTVIASATSGLTMMGINQYNNVFSKEDIILQTGLQQQNNVQNLCNAVISGIVSITACCNNIELWAAAVIGFFGCIIYHQTKRLLKRYEIDDPLDIT